MLKDAVTVVDMYPCNQRSADLAHFSAALLREIRSQGEATEQEGHPMPLSWDHSLREAPAHILTPTQGPSPTKAAHRNSDPHSSESWHE